MGACGYGPFESDAAWDWRSRLYREKRRLNVFRSPAKVSEMIDKTLEDGISDKGYGGGEVRAAAALIYLFDLPKKKKAIKALKRVMFNSRWIAAWRSVDKILNAIKRQIEDLGGKVDIKEAKAKANAKRENIWQEYLRKLAKDGPDALGQTRLNILERSRGRRYRRTARLKRRKK